MGSCTAPNLDRVMLGVTQKEASVFDDYIPLATFIDFSE